MFAVQLEKAKSNLKSYEKIFNYLIVRRGSTLLRITNFLQFTENQRKTLYLSTSQVGGFVLYKVFCYEILTN